MKDQIDLTIDGQAYVALTRGRYEQLVELVEDAADAAAVERFKERLAAGDEELLPSEMVDRMLAGENLVRVWREHRGLTVSALAEKAGIAQPYLSQIETGKREGTLQTMKKIADALRVTLDDLV
ncbi:helix-turn-helix domain-containing protein [Bosea sp. (in: a-proteobacteria)]|jgi:DNA-binding XRE family transcriptional regulator|uniref:helix-turn-helix domain-containing protein n=1 Tax=Bosea sp. (in: a-proteobacteria) TaxID=1871050 RepID=UPI00356AAE40